MGRRAPIAAMASGLISNPYAPAKEYVAQTTLCELCNITMKTRDWAAHKNSKKHRAAEKKEFEKNNPPVDGFGDHADGFNTDAHGGFGANPSANTNGGSDGRACFGCGETGHTKRDCPQGGSGGLGGSGGQACYGCGEEGHQKRDCPQGAGGQACFNCGNVGHRKTECHEPLKPRGGGRACFNCGQEGHSSRECTGPRVMRCRNCDAEGHISKECPKPRDYSRVKCNNCGQMGHTVKRCTEPVAETSGDGWGDGNGDSGAAAGGWAEAEGDAGAAQQSTDWAEDANDAAAAVADANEGGR